MQRRSRPGRKPGPNPLVRHRSRERFSRGHPGHVTLKVRRDVPSLRTVKLVRAVERSFARGCERGEIGAVSPARAAHADRGAERAALRAPERAEARAARVASRGARPGVVGPLVRRLETTPRLRTRAARGTATSGAGAELAVDDGLASARTARPARGSGQPLATWPVDASPTAEISRPVRQQRAHSEPLRSNPDRNEGRDHRRKAWGGATTLESTRKEIDGSGGKVLPRGRRAPRRSQEGWQRRQRAKHFRRLGRPG